VTPNGGYRVPTPAIPLPLASSVCSAARRPLDGTPTAVTDRERRLAARARQSRRGWYPRTRPWGRSRQPRLTQAGALPLSCSHEILEQGISPPSAYSSAESGKTRELLGSSPPSDIARHDCARRDVLGSGRDARNVYLPRPCWTRCGAWPPQRHPRVVRWQGGTAICAKLDARELSASPGLRWRPVLVGLLRAQTRQRAVIACPC